MKQIFPNKFSDFLASILKHKILRCDRYFLFLNLGIGNEIFVGFEQFIYSFYILYFSWSICLMNTFIMSYNEFTFLPWMTNLFLVFFPPDNQKHSWVVLHYPFSSLIKIIKKEANRRSLKKYALFEHKLT